MGQSGGNTTRKWSRLEFIEPTPRYDRDPFMLFISVAIVVYNSCLSSSSKVFSNCSHGHGSLSREYTDTKFNAKNFSN